MKEKERVQAMKCTHFGDGVLLICVLNFLHYLHFCSHALQKMVMPLTSRKKLKFETYSTKSIIVCLSLTQNLALTQTMTMERVQHMYQFRIPLCVLFNLHSLVVPLAH